MERTLESQGHHGTCHQWYHRWHGCRGYLLGADEDSRMICVRCRAAFPGGGLKNCPSCAGKNREKRRLQRERIRAETFQQYGELCLCCGETEEAFLTLDHINGDGAAHRLALTGNKTQGGHIFYMKLRQQGRPSGLQVLCWNCNAAKQHRGRCPHQQESIR